MNEAMMALAERAVKAADWDDVEGWLTHTTHAGGYPKCNAGIAIRADSNGSLSDAVVEGMFGPITWEPSHHHPDFAALYEQHERDIEAAWARVLPDLSDFATIGCLLALVRKKHGPEVFFCPTAMVADLWRGYRSTSEPWPFVTGKSEVEALVSALEVE